MILWKIIKAHLIKGKNVKYMSFTVLITGGTGFIGSNLVREYLKRNAEVHLIIREESNLTQIADVKSKLHLHIYDGRFDSLDIAIQKIKPNVVFHLASLYITEHQPGDITTLIQSNITFGTHLVEAMVKNGVKHLINTGTSWQHYHNESYNPVNLYAATKEAFEKIIKYYVESYELKYTTLKLFDTYGPNDPRKKLFYLLKQRSNTSQPLDMSPGEQQIDIVYVDDVVKAFIIAADSLNKGLINQKYFAISSGNPIRLRDLIDLYKEIMDVELPINWGGRAYRKREVMETWNQGERLPGWEPKVSLTEGILALNNKN
ncbi:NAD-dependent epimerase/dehydratase family protein [Robertmurraya kyonggiensis]|uniref:NAD(P)-dependent oxidoreductase n=1 Tax=Robertmurraya kyonggiensis TaxID=1037680 RepID=A0A4U1D719_9BACI|nr:NAD(P)-dependent oxidoreductase [Robertmurraya kyonggiensis]TKC16987.1 NAD(P)-dependent oxidoreductase [Robertmurraya kyonggiensis]